MRSSVACCGGVQHAGALVQFLAGPTSLALFLTVFIMQGLEEGELGAAGRHPRRQNGRAVAIIAGHGWNQ